MKKEIEMILVLVLTMLMLWFGIMFYLIGKSIYGSDIAIIWVAGMLTHMGVIGLASLILYLWEELIK